MTEELQAMDFADERGDGESIVEELEDIVSTVSIPDDHIERIMGVIGKTTVDFSLVSITNREGTILFVNDIFCQVSKYPREELLGQNHRILNSGYFGETGMKEKDVRKGMYDNLSVGKKREATIRNKAKDGSFYRVKSIMESYNIEGAVYRVSVRHEVTEIMEQQERLEAQASELEDAKTKAEGMYENEKQSRLRIIRESTKGFLSIMRSFIIFFILMVLLTITRGSDIGDTLLPQLLGGLLTAMGTVLYVLSNKKSDE